MVTGKTIEEAKRSAGHMVDLIVDKLQQLGLSVAPEKTEAVMLASKRKKHTVQFTVKNRTVTTKEAIKYLGIWVSRDLHLGCHLRETAEKANTAAMALTRIGPN